MNPNGPGFSLMIANKVSFSTNDEAACQYPLGFTIGYTSGYSCTPLTKSVHRQYGEPRDPGRCNRELLHRSQTDEPGTAKRESVSG